MLLTQWRFKKIFIILFCFAVLGCENNGRGSDAKSAKYIPESIENAEAIAVMQKFFSLQHDANMERQGGSAAESHNPCTIAVRAIREPQGKGRAFEIVLNEAMEGGKTRSVQFKVWDFSPSKRSWSHKRDVGSVVKKPFELRMDGLILMGSVRSLGFNTDNILMFQQSTEQSLAARKADNGALEVTIKNNESGVLANLLAEPDVISCRFDSTNV